MTELLLSVDSKVSKQYVLLVVDKKWIEKICKGKKTSESPGKRKRRKKIALIMKGNQILYAHDHSESAVVRRLEYSNTLLLAASPFSTFGLPAREHQIASKAVLSMLNVMFHLQRAPPTLNAVELLRATYVTRDELSTPGEKPEGNAYTFSELCVQSNTSPEQLANVLQEKGAIVFQGKVRLLHQKEIFSVLHDLVLLVGKQQVLSFSDATKSVDTLLSSVPPIVISVVRNLYEEPKISSPDSPYLLHLNPLRTLQALAGHLFLEGKVSKEESVQGIKIYGVDTSTLLSSWIETAPELLFQACGLDVKNLNEKQLLGLLEGLTITNEKTRMSWWIPEDFLPYQIDKRISVLFDINPNKWTEKELKAYAQPLLNPEQNFSHIIQRYAREYQLPGQPVMYSKLSQEA